MGKSLTEPQKKVQALNVRYRKNLSDEELIARALAAGWEETETGRWQIGPGFSCKGGAEHLRHPTELGLGFDHDLNCMECEAPIWLCWDPVVTQELVENSFCHGCNYWLARVRKLEKDDPNTTKLINWGGKTYFLGEDRPPSKSNGFGGQRFEIERLNGTVEVIHNLWFNGKVPPRFAERLPENVNYLGLPREETSNG